MSAIGINLNRSSILLCRYYYVYLFMTSPKLCTLYLWLMIEMCMLYLLIRCLKDKDYKVLICVLKLIHICVQNNNHFCQILNCLSQYNLTYYIIICIKLAGSENSLDLIVIIYQYNFILTAYITLFNVSEV